MRIAKISISLLFIGLHLFILNPSVAGQSISAPINSPAKYSFIVAGHSYGPPYPSYIGVYPKFLNHLQKNLSQETKLIILNGDIVWGENILHAWQQVQADIASLDLPYYFVMGNHDYTQTAQDIFVKKYGDTYYSFDIGSERFIILDSQKSFLSISSDQLEFLENSLQESPATNVFVFFSELLWNGNNAKYSKIKANRNSRASFPLLSRSNYWNEVHPILQKHSDKNIYVITGDVGGQADAIPAFYEKIDHITLIATGMGAIKNENYLEVNIENGKASFTLVPLNSDNTLKPLNYYTPENLGRVTSQGLLEYGVRLAQEIYRIIQHPYFLAGLVSSYFLPQFFIP